MFSVGPSITNIFEQLTAWIDSDNFHSRIMVFMFLIIRKQVAPTTLCSIYDALI